MQKSYQTNSNKFVQSTIKFAAAGSSQKKQRNQTIELS